MFTNRPAMQKGPADQCSAKIKQNSPNMKKNFIRIRDAVQEKLLTD